MKCAKLLDIKKISVIDVPEPVQQNRQVIVAMKAVGICGSDVHYYNIGRIGTDQLAKFPQSLGHECAGEVVESFPGSSFKPGDRVAIEPARPCMNCEMCRCGRYNCCPHVEFLGSPGMQGAFQERIAIDESQIQKIPDSMSFDEAAILEPMGVAYHAIKIAQIIPGQSVAIFGTGPIGLLTLAMARACGAGEIFMVDLLQYRLDFASKVYKADHCINANITDPIEYIQKATHGRGVDITFEAAGQPQTNIWAVETARIGGKALIIGIPEVDSITFNPHPMRRKELTIQNVRRSNMALEPCIGLVKKGTVSVKQLATNHFTLENIDQAFNVVGTYSDGVIRAIITF